MAYKTAELEKKAIEAIEKHKLFFIDDLCAFLPCSRATFYNLGLDKLDTIKDALEKNRIEVKTSMRSKWYKSDAPALQIALYKLIGTDAEADRINSQKTSIDITSKGKELQAPSFNFMPLDDEPD